MRDDFAQKIFFLNIVHLLELDLDLYVHWLEFVNFNQD